MGCSTHGSVIVISYMTGDADLIFHLNLNHLNGLHTSYFLKPNQFVWTHIHFSSTAKTDDE